MAGYMLRGATVLDGTGRPAFRGDVTLWGPVFGPVGPDAPGSGLEVLGAGGLVVVPGFVDPHAGVEPDRLGAPDAPAALAAGVTTALVGHPGAAGGDAPALVRDVAGGGLPADVGAFAALGQAGGLAAGAPSGIDPQAVREVKRAVARAIGLGAFGLAVRLEGPLLTDAGIDVLIEMARVPAAHGGILVGHIASDAAAQAGTIALLTAGRLAELPVHLAGAGGLRPETVAQVVESLEGSTRRGIRATADLRPGDPGAPPLARWPHAAVGSGPEGMGSGGRAAAFFRFLAEWGEGRAGSLGVEEAVRRMTSWPAYLFGLNDRGVIRRGAKADCAVFDPGKAYPAALGDGAGGAGRAGAHTPEAPEPGAFPGLIHLFVSGVPVIRDGRPTGARPGRALRLNP